MCRPLLPPLIPWSVIFARLSRKQLAGCPQSPSPQLHPAPLAFCPVLLALLPGASPPSHQCKPGVRDPLGTGLGRRSGGPQSQADTFGVCPSLHSHNQHSNRWASRPSLLVGSCPPTDCPAQALVSGSALRGPEAKSPVLVNWAEHATPGPVPPFPPPREGQGRIGKLTPRAPLPLFQWWSLGWRTVFSYCPK